MKRRHAALFAFGVAFAALACKKVLGLSGEPGVYEPPDSSAIALDGESPIDLPGDAACDANRVNDPRHCGSCGRSCLGSTCQAGRCVPELVLRLDGQNTGVFTVHDGVVYAVDRRDIVRAEGTSKTTVASFAEPPSPARLLVDDQRIVLATFTDGLLGCPAAGCTGAPTVIAPGIIPGATPLPGSTEPWPYVWLASGRLQTYAGGGAVSVGDAGLGEAICANLAANDSYAFFADFSANAIRTIGRKPGGAAVVRSFRATSPCALATSAERIFWSDTSSVWRAKVGADGTITSAIALALDTTMPGSIAADDTYAYWDNGSLESAEVYRCAVDGCDGKPETVLSGLERINQLEIDRQYLYFSTSVNVTAGVEIYRVAR